MASDLDATIAFWRDGFGGEVVHDAEFAGARNVFLRVASGRIHLYDQPPKTSDRGTVHQVGVLTDDLGRQRQLTGVSVPNPRLKRVVKRGPRSRHLRPRAHGPGGEGSPDVQSSDSTSMRIASSVAAMSWSRSLLCRVSRNRVRRDPSPSGATLIDPR
jgi:catechol 2,3-dioxygenase-like lactoylglutathione lyase family enzyme